MLAQSLDTRHIMTYEKDGSPLSSADILHLPDGFLLELGVAYGEDLVHNQDFRIQMGGYGKTESDRHTGGIALHRRVNITLTP